MVELSLPDRPVGVRKSWRRVEPDLVKLGEELRPGCFFVQDDWGYPILGAEFFDRRGLRRRIEAVYANGKHVSIRIRKNGDRSDVCRTLPGRGR